MVFADIAANNKAIGDNLIKLENMLEIYNKAHIVIPNSNFSWQAINAIRDTIAKAK